jgi:predicted transcriptional regulator
MEFPPLGEQEKELLAFVNEHAPASAAAVVEGFGESRGLARTTVLTVLERLRRKGYLTRQRRRGVYHYSPRMSETEVQQGLLHRFVETTLDGSLAPVVTYLTRSGRLSGEELAELQRLIETMKAQEAAAGEEDRNA